MAWKWIKSSTCQARKRSGGEWEDWAWDPRNDHGGKHEASYSGEWEFRDKPDVEFQGYCGMVGR
jgi:hypothetical protein